MRCARCLGSFIIHQLLLAMLCRPQAAPLPPTTRRRIAGVAGGLARPGGALPAPRPSPVTHVTSTPSVSPTGGGGAGAPLFGDGIIIIPNVSLHSALTLSKSARPVALKYQNNGSCGFHDHIQQPLNTTLIEPTSQKTSIACKILEHCSRIVNKLSRLKNMYHDIELLLLMSGVEPNPGLNRNEIKSCHVNISSITAHG